MGHCHAAMEEVPLLATDDNERKAARPHRSIGYNTVAFALGTLVVSGIALSVFFVSTNAEYRYRTHTTRGRSAEQVGKSSNIGNEMNAAKKSFWYCILSKPENSTTAQRWIDGKFWYVAKYTGGTLIPTRV